MNSNYTLSRVAMNIKFIPKRIIYIWKITQHMVPNIDGTMGYKIETRKHPKHGTQCFIQYPTITNPAQFLQENAITVLCLGCTTHCQNIWTSKVLKLKNSNFELDEFLELILREPKMPNYVTAARSNSIIDQLSHLRAQKIYQGGGVPYSIGHGARLAASKSLQVSKYHEACIVPAWREPLPQRGMHRTCVKRDATTTRHASYLREESSNDDQ